MTNEQMFGLVIVIMVVVMISVMHVSKNAGRIKRTILDRRNIRRAADTSEAEATEDPVIDSWPIVSNSEENSKTELERVQKLIEDRKQAARDIDISYHLWSFYQSHFQDTSPHQMDGFIEQGEWYDVKILRNGTRNGMRVVDFKLQGAGYKFVDDQENQGWSDNIKLFSLSLYDDSDNCLVEIPMKVKVDKWGRHYSILLDGPRAFLPGDWIKEFVKVKLKHQQVRNKEIREQKHKERLSEIEDLKARFGISD